MHNNVDVLFNNLWNNYLSVTPSAKKVHELLSSTQADDLINDHIALRTFNIEKVGLEKLAAHFKAVGYTQCGDYEFVEKKLRAKHYEHSDPTKPKVFISELLVEEFSPELQQVINDLVAQVDEAAVLAEDFLYSGTHWSIDYPTYQKLLAESEYAAWTAAWGYCANHFTVSINYLTNFNSIEVVNNTLKEAGLVLNSTGGEIKGSSAVLLEQSSTLADNAQVKFSDGLISIPSCFYEFALRYNKADGNIFTGFVAASADKIFESTNTRAEGVA